MFEIRPWLMALTLLAGLSACDSNDDRRTAVRHVDNAYGGGTPPPGATGPATIEFPPPVSRTQDATVMARGRLESGVTASLGGIDLSPDEDGRWQLELPLELGANSFALQYTAAGESVAVEAALRVTRAPDDLVSLTDLAVDVDGERLLILDSALNRLVAVDFETQTPINLISDDTEFNDPYSLSIDRAQNRALVLQGDGETPLLAVDLASGGVTEIEVPDFINDHDRLISLPVVLLADGDGFLALSRESLLVDISSRERLSLADLIGSDVDPEQPPTRPANSVDSSYPVIYRFDAEGRVDFIFEYEDRDDDIRFGQLYGFAAVPGDPAVYVSDAVSIKRIDRASGAISQLITAAAQNKDLPDLNLTENAGVYSYVAPRNLTLQPELDRLIALDNSRVVAIDLADGEAEVLASDRLQDEDPIRLSSVQALRVDGERAWVLDDAQDRVIELNLETGARRLAFGRVDVDAAPLLNPADIALNPATLRAYVTDNARGNVLEIDLNDGTNRVLAAQGGLTDDPISLGTPLALEIAGDGSKVLLINSRSELIGIDTTSGDKELLLAFDPDRDLRRQASRYQLYDLALDAAAGVAYVSNLDTRRGAEIRRLPPTGAASEVVTNVTRSNRTLPISSPIALAVDAERERLLVVDSGLKSLLAVDLATGARSFLSERPEPGAVVPLIRTPQDLVIDARGGRALVLDSSRQGLVAVDLETGALSLVGELEVETRDRIYTPRGLTVHPTFEYALIVDNTTDKIWALDLLTGERVSIGR